MKFMAWYLGLALWVYLLLSAPLLGLPWKIFCAASIVLWVIGGCALVVRWLLSLAGRVKMPGLPNSPKELDLGRKEKA